MATTTIPLVFPAVALPSSGTVLITTPVPDSLAPMTELQFGEQLVLNIEAPAAMGGKQGAGAAKPSA